MPFTADLAEVPRLTQAKPHGNGIGDGRLGKQHSNGVACFVLLSDPTEWTLLRNNRLEVLGPDDEWIEYYGRAQVLELAMVSEPR